MRVSLAVFVIAALFASAFAQQGVVTIGAWGSTSVENLDTGVSAYELEAVECLEANGCFVVVHPLNGAGTSFDAGAQLALSGLIPMGTNTHVNVTESTDFSTTAQSAYFMLHADTNGNGVYDGPGTDAPIDTASEATNPCTFVFHAGTAKVGSQLSGSGGFATLLNPYWATVVDSQEGLFVSRAVTQFASFLVVHDSGDLGTVYGSVAIHHGINEGVWIPTTGLNVGTSVLVMLHIDTDPTDGAYNPSNDPPYGPSATVVDSEINPLVTVESADVVDPNIGATGGDVGFSNSFAVVDNKLWVNGQLGAFFAASMVGIHVDTGATNDRFVVATGSDDGIIGTPTGPLGGGSHYCVYVDFDDVAYAGESGNEANIVMYEDSNGNGMFDASTDTQLSGAFSNRTVYDGVSGLLEVTSVIELSTSHDVSNQAVCNGGPAIQVYNPATTYAAGPSFVVVHRDDSGSFGAAIGASFVQHGSNGGDGYVCLSEEVADGETLWAMFHVKGDGECVGVGPDDYNPAVDAPYNGATTPGDTLKQFTVGASGSAAVLTAVGDVPPGPNTLTAVVDINSDTYVSADSFESWGTSDGHYVVVHPPTDAACTTTFDATVVLNDATATFLPSGEMVCSPTFDLSSAAVGDSIFLMVHAEEGTNQQYDGPGVDPPVSVAGALSNPLMVIDTIMDQQVAVDATNLTNTELVVDIGSPRDLVIGYAVSVGSSFIVVHEDDNGSFGAVIGASAALTHGLNNDVAITVDRDIVDGETLWLMLHIDADPCDGNGYDPTAGDDPVSTTENNALVQVQAKVEDVASSSNSGSNSSSGSGSSSDAAATTVSVLAMVVVALFAMIVA